MRRFFKSEDWLAVWFGFLIIILVLIGGRPQMPTFKWATESEFRAMVVESKPMVEKFIKDVELKGDAKLLAATLSLKSSIEAGDRVGIHSSAKKLGDTLKTTEDPVIKKEGIELSKKLSEGAGALVSKVFSKANILKSIYIGVAFLIITTIGITLMGGNVVAYVAGFPVIYGLSWFSQFIAGNSTINYWGLEYVIFALLIGLFISNVIGVPSWLKEAVRTEYYIKTGLVILGAGILFFEDPASRGYRNYPGNIGCIRCLVCMFLVGEEAQS